MPDSESPIGDQENDALASTTSFSPLWKIVIFLFYARRVVPSADKDIFPSDVQTPLDFAATIARPFRAGREVSWRSVLPSLLGREIFSPFAAIEIKSGF